MREECAPGTHTQILRIQSPICLRRRLTSPFFMKCTLFCTGWGLVWVGLRYDFGWACRKRILLEERPWERGRKENPKVRLRGTQEDLEAVALRGLRLPVLV